MLNYMLLLMWLLYYKLLDYLTPTRYYKSTATTEDTEQSFVPYSNPHKKPSWVKEKVMYLKMHLPDDGCRKIAMHFNRLYAHKEISVSKSYVYRVFKENAYEIVRMRKEMRNKKPYKKERNQMWHMDLATIDKKQILGIIDAGTRALVALKHLPSKSTISIIRALLDTIEEYGKPKSIRSDNEIVFTSKLMRFTLWVLGI